MDKNEKKLKILVISDHPYAPSGVAGQSRYFIEALKKTGRFSFVCLGGAVKHRDYTPQKVDDDLLIYPVDGYGNPDIVRSVIRNDRPDILWFMTDPRFYEWLWNMGNEIRPLIPMIYAHVWDNYPYPKFNQKFYESNDHIACISKTTYDIVKKVAPSVDCSYMPHAVDSNIFKKLSDDVRKEILPTTENKFVIFWNNRNARRKMSGTLIFWFKEFIDKIGHDKAVLVMHTDPKDPNGQDLEKILIDLELLDGQVLISNQNVSPDVLAKFYNAADLTTTISDAEGFGLCLESSTILDTYNGMKNISDIQAGDRVLSMGSPGVGQFNTQYCKVLATSKRKDKTLKLKTIGIPDIICSHNHPFYTYYENRWDMGREGNHVWKKADELKVGDKLCVKKRKLDKELQKKIDLVEWFGDKPGIRYDEEKIYYKMGFSPHKDGLSISDIQEKYNVSKHYAEQARRVYLGESNIRRYGENNKFIIDEIVERMKKDNVKVNNKLNKINRYIDVNEEFLNLVGWYLAEGSNLGGKGIELDMNRSEKDIVVRLGEYIKKNFDSDCLIEIREEGNVCRLTACSQIMAEMFKIICGNHAKNKKINKMFFQSASSLAPLIRGLFNGDGHHDGKSWRLSTISKDLAWQVRDILASVGIFSSVKARSQGENGFVTENDIYTVGVYGIYCEKFCEWTKLKNDFSSKRIMSKVEEDEDFFFIPITSIEEHDEVELYDIQVEDTRNFIANGVVVHNSTLESLNCGTPILTSYTGGLKDQVTDGKNQFGRLIKPCSRAVVGSQQVPYIYEDRISKESFLKELSYLYKKWKNNKPAYNKLGELGQKHVDKNFNFAKFEQKWVDIVDNVYKRCGSWETRKGYDSWKIKEIV